MQTASVTVIGLGSMGQALAATLLQAGHPTTVWNRSPEKADTLVAQGAVHAGTLAEAVAASELIIICVLDYDVVSNLLDPARDALAGRVLVNLTNGTPAHARACAEWATARGADYLDGGIMAVPPLIGQPEALLLYSGSQTAFEAHQTTLGRLGAAVYLDTDAGLAALYDLALLSGMYGLFSGFLHSAALVGTERINATRLLTLLTPWVNAMLEALPSLAEQIDSGDYTKDVTSNLGMQAVAFNNIVEAGAAQGIRNDLIAPMQALMDRRIADGHVTDDISSLIELIRQPAS
jgi:3-hydroxyisobutyrate dehydrogenase-like beta-hydroxyacid dehydrogenase